MTSAEDGRPPQDVPLDPRGVAEVLGEAIRLPTVSHQDPTQFDPRPFAELRALFEASFPNVHAHLKREVVAEHSLLYTWEGSDPALPPALLMGHLDVVPVEKGTEKNWTHPPFSGAIADGFVWGRGALDTKGSVVAILAAGEALLGRGFRPRRTVYLAFGHDEEVSGRRGAKGIASLLASRGVRLAWVLDEGGSVLAAGAVPGVRAPVASVGVAEKGYLTVRLTARGRGGHSAMPPRDTAIRRLVRALGRLEPSPFPPQLREPTRSFLAAVAPAAPLGKRILFSSLSLLGRPVALAMARSPATAALVQTTAAVTILQAGAKENVVPQTAEARVNLRLLPGETVEGALAHLRRAVGPGIEVEPAAEGWNPSPVSSPRAEAFQALSRVVRELFPGTLVAPSLVLGATDARHYAPLAESTFRFIPVVLARDDLGRIHGTDERIGVHALDKAVLFYARLLQEAA